MYSNYIYHTCVDRTPYTYLIGWSNLNKWYYGRRTSKGCHPTDLWIKYFTSSKSVKQYRKQFGEPDVVQTRHTFHTIEQCCVWETKVLTRLNAKNKEKWLNRTNGDLKFDNSGKVYVVDVNGKTMTVSTNDPRYISGELICYKKGKNNTIKDIDAWKEGYKESMLRNHGVDNPGKTKKSREKAKQRMIDNNPSKNQSTETKSKIKNSMIDFINKLSPEELSLKYGKTGDDNHFFCKHHREETKNSLSIKNSKYTYKLVSPTGEIFLTHSLKMFSENNNLCRHALMKYINKGKVPTHKNFSRELRINTTGWEIIIITSS